MYAYSLFVPTSEKMDHSGSHIHALRSERQIMYSPGLEKLTNANRSVSTGNDRLFLVELMEIADWKSMSEYMLHSNFRKKLTRVIGGNFGAYTFILPLPYFLNICPPFWIFTNGKILKHNKNTSEFQRTNSGHFRPLEWFCSSSVSEVVLNAAAKSSCFNMRVIKNNNK